METNLVKYTSKDYNSILNDLIDAIPGLTDLWTSREDGDPGIVLVKLMSALGDMLSYNLDKQALEYYAPTVTQRKNAQKLFDLVGYKMHWYRAATTQITVTNKVDMPDYIVYLKQMIDAQDNMETVSNLITAYKNEFGPSYNNENEICIPPLINENDVRLPQSMINEGKDRYSLSYLNTNTLDFLSYAQIVYNYWKQDNVYSLHTFVADPLRSIEVYSSDSSGVIYSLIPTVIANAQDGVYNPTVNIYPYESKQLQAIQGYLCSTTFTSAQLKDNCFYVPDANLDESHMYLCYKTVDGNTQTDTPIFIGFSENLLLETDGQLHFQFKVDEFDYPYIEISSYWKDIIGESNVTFTFYYFRTLGKSGVITKNYLNKMNSGSAFSAEVTNIANTEYVIDTNGNVICSPGFNPQTAHEAYIDSLNYIMTYNTLVTIYDFQRFSKRQSGISNSFACDGQYADDINKQILKVCNSYTYSQLRNILGSSANIIPDQDLATALYNIKKINANYKDNCITALESTNASGTASGDNPTEFTKYTIQIYPIYGNFSQDSGTDNSIKISKFDNVISGSTTSPYKYYKIYTEDDNIDPDTQSYEVATYLDEQFDTCRIVNVKPEYATIRVFPWRACGTIHLTKSVSQQDANNIVRNVITAIASAYSPDKVEIGQKIDYMELIDVILSADSRIRYFDAGLGDRKLIVFEEQTVTGHQTNNNVFNIEAYFNPISIMQYVQTYSENVNIDQTYYNYISVDPTYIQTVI